MHWRCGLTTYTVIWLCECWHREAKQTLLINQKNKKFQHLAAVRPDHLNTTTLSWGAVVTRKLVFLNFYFPVTQVLLLCLLWGNIYMLIICHPTISSEVVLVSPQEHHGIIYSCQDPGINDTPLSLRLTRLFVLLPRKSSVILWLVAKNYGLVCGWYGFVERNGSLLFLT